MRFQRKYSSPPCSKCGSENTIVKRFVTKCGSREYFCKDCRKCFSIRIEAKPKPEPKQVNKVKPKPLPKTVTKPLCSQCGKQICECARLKEIEEKKSFEEKLDRESEFQKNVEFALSFDSIKNVPCFLCLEQNRHCVEKCESLESFLMGGILK